MKPVIKWTGGKTQMLTELKNLITPELLNGHTYIEPFCGGAALALDLVPEKCILNDLNSELINLYQVISSDPIKLITKLTEFQTKHCEDFYYSVRAWDRDSDNFSKISNINRAARFMYLNRTCFNGLYRVNQKGFMNSPLGKTSSGKVPDIVQEDRIKDLHNYLHNYVNLYNSTYSEVTKLASTGDTVFLDPPYLFTYTGYTKEGFTLEDTIALKKECDRLNNLGCNFVLTNDNNETIKELFKDYEIQEVSVRRSINRNGNNRTGTEVIITNINKC